MIYFCIQCLESIDFPQYVNEIQSMNYQIKRNCDHIDKIFISLMQAKKVFDSLRRSLDDSCILNQINEHNLNLGKMQNNLTIFSEEMKIALTKIYSAINNNQVEIYNLKKSVDNINNKLDRILDILSKSPEISPAG